ncbi:MAG TPA: MlaD family protein [Bacteroidia bacterium]|nr:MlaD family protein [Bacteroidia bacterium]
MKISRELKTGIVAVIAIAIFVYGFNFLKGKNIFSKQDTYYAIYPQVSGIVEANPVQVNGFKVGRVNKIELLDTTGRLLVTISISDEKLKIKKGTTARIVSSDLLGAKAIELIMSNSSEYAKDGDTLMAETEASLQETVNATVKPLKDKAEKLIGSIDSIITVAQTVLNKSSQDNIIKSFDNIKHTLETFDKTAVRLDNMVASEQSKISNIFSKVEAISTNLANNSDKISNVIKNFSSISDTLAKANIAKTIDKASNALAQVSDIMEKINKGQGSAGLLVNDTKLYNNLTAASGSLDSLMKDMELYPWRYFSLYGKKKRTRKP